MKAVILAAGRGTRMPEITKELPKCLIEIGKESILTRQIKILQRNSIDKICLVIGFMAEEIRKAVSDYENIEIIENYDYATTDNIYSLFLTNDFLKGEEFILLNGDAVFDEEILSKLVERKNQNVAPVDSKHYDLEELKIREENGLVVEILPKNSPENISDGSTIGIFKFSSEGSTILFEKLKQLTVEGVKNRWFEYALNCILKKIHMHKLDIHGLKWIEVDTIDDVNRSIELFGE